MQVSYSRNDKLVGRKFYHYLIPTVLMVLAMQFGSLADSIVVGNMLGESFLSAASLALPSVFLAELPGLAIATGAGILGANFIGKRQISEASKVFKIALWSSFLLSLLFVPLGFAVADPVATWLSGNFADLQPMIKQYVQVYFIQAPILGLGLTVAYWLPSDNSPTLGALYFIIANVVHLAFEVLFCLTLSKDVAMIGAASSTGIGMVAGFVVLIPYFLSKKRTIDLKTSLKGSLKFLGPIFKAGSGSAAYFGVGVFYTLMINIAATNFLQAPEMVVFAMLSNFTFVVDLCLIGIFQVMPSIIPALYGEKDYFGIHGVVKRVFVISAIVTLILTAISLIFPELFFYIFGVDLPGLKDQFVALKPHGITDPLFIIRIFVISFIPYSLNKFLVNYYPSIMVFAPGVLSNGIRVGLFGAIGCFFLICGLGVMGYSVGAFLMEACTFVIVLAFIPLLKKIKKMKVKGILLLPEPAKDSQGLDISIPAEEEEIGKAIEQIQRFAAELSKDEKAAALLALATEEIIANTITYGYKRHSGVQYIDLNLAKADDKMIVRIRDDGVSFDPTTYQEEEGEEMRYHGINVIRSIASSFTYLRVLSTNNTIMEIDLSKKEGA